VRRRPFLISRDTLRGWMIEDRQAIWAVVSAFAPSGGPDTLCSRKGVKRDEVPGMWIDGDQRAA